MRKKQKGVSKLRKKGKRREKERERCSGTEKVRMMWKEDNRRKERLLRT